MLIHTHTHMHSLVIFGIRFSFFCLFSEFTLYSLNVRGGRKLVFAFFPPLCFKLGVIFTALAITPIGYNNILLTCTIAQTAEMAQALTLSFQQQNKFPSALIVCMCNFQFHIFPLCWLGHVSHPSWWAVACLYVHVAFLPLPDHLSMLLILALCLHSSSD